MATRNKQLWVEKQPHETYAQALLRVAKTTKNGAGDYFRLDAEMLETIRKLNYYWNHVCGWWEQGIGMPDGIFVPVLRHEIAVRVRDHMRSETLGLLWGNANFGDPRRFHKMGYLYDDMWRLSQTEIMERALRTLETPFATEITVNDPLDGVWYFREQSPVDDLSQDHLKWLRWKAWVEDAVNNDMEAIYILLADALLLIKHDGNLRWNFARDEIGAWEFFVYGHWAPCEDEMARVHIMSLLYRYYLFLQTRAATMIAKHPRLLDKERETLSKLYVVSEYLSKKIFDYRLSCNVVKLLIPIGFQSPIGVTDRNIDDSWMDRGDVVPYGLHYHHPNWGHRLVDDTSDKTGDENNDDADRP